MTDAYFVFAGMVFVAAVTYAVWIWADVVNVVNDQSYFEPEFSTHVAAALVTLFVLGVASIAWPLALLVLGTLKVKAIVTKGART